MSGTASITTDVGHTVIGTGTTVAALTNMPIDLRGWGGLSAQITGITASTVQFEGSNDGTNYVSVVGISLGVTASSGVSSTAGNGFWVFPKQYRYFRCRLSVAGGELVTATINIFNFCPVLHSHGVAAAQSGTWNITNISGTVSLPTGASTEATLAKLAVAQGTALGSNVGPMVLGSVTTAAPTYTTGQISPLSLTIAGELRVKDTNAALAQASTTSGQFGSLIQGAVTTSAPTYTTAQTDPLSLTTSGELRVKDTNAALAQASTTSGQLGSLILGAVTTADPSYTTAQSNPLSLDTAGYLRTRLLSGGATAAAVPANANYVGINVAGNLRGPTGVNPSGTVYAQQTDLASVGGTSFALGHQTATGCIPVLRAKGTKTFSTAAPTSVAALALAANTNRIVAGLVNNGTQTVYLGKDNTVTTSNGIPLPINTSFIDEDSTDAWWHIVASGTGDLRIVEVA